MSILPIKLSETIKLLLLGVCKGLGKSHSYIRYEGGNQYKAYGEENSQRSQRYIVQNIQHIYNHSEIWKTEWPIKNKIKTTVVINE